jgi:hypothetical protein
MALSADAATAPAAPTEDAAEAVAATAPVPVENGANVWPDENAEAAFIADARQRGEPVVAVAATREAAEEKEDDKKALPPLADLMKRLAPEVRETLDDLFRAKFTGVRRVPKKFLKTAGG